jgi:polyhydroxyalkanoate synthesis repressor PhaR
MPRVIKRYANRKLYDQQASRYVSLDDLLVLIRAGEDVQVLDAGTGDDLTSVTLAQVILERERARRGGLPATFLHQIIRHGETWQDFVTSSMRTSLEGMLTTQRQADRFFRDWANRTGLLPTTPPEPEASEPPPVDEAPPPGPGDAGRDADGDDVGELRRQMAALEARLRALEGGD